MKTKPGEEVWTVTVLSSSQSVYAFPGDDWLVKQKSVAVDRLTPRLHHIYTIRVVQPQGTRVADIVDAGVAGLNHAFGTKLDPKQLKWTKA